MNNPNIIHLINILSKFGNKYIDSSHQLKRQDLLADVNDYNKVLIQTLADDPETRQAYFIPISNIYVFKADKFSQAVRDAGYWLESHTDYENHVGLAVDHHYLQDSSNVVLDFPHKDCVLQGGMTTEDTKNNVNERFYNDTISAPQIDNMFAPKILCDVKKYDKNHLDGKSVTSFNPDTDNIMIKANNLIALHSLTNDYFHKVKMIYIDPPYNTGHDGFNYNDRFSESTWLVFIKNRLEQVKKLLKNDGVIAISCDDNEQAYLKVLADEIFGKKNFIANITVVVNKGGNRSNNLIATTNNYVLMYAKNINNTKLYPLTLSKKEIKKGHWHKSKCQNNWWKISHSLKMTGADAARSRRPKLFYPIYVSKDNSIHLSRHSITDIKHLPRTNGKDMRWRWSREKIANQSNNILVKRDKNDIPKLYILERQKMPTEKPTTLFENNSYGTNNGTKEISALFGSRNVFKYPKPEELVRDLIDICSTNHRDKPNDIVMDFFSGSATTQAVAMKMHRRFIGVEQMNYPISKSDPTDIYVSRLEKVIKGEQGGISKAVKWQGGGSFIFATFLNKNQRFIQLVQNAKDSNQLDHIYHQMKDSADIRLDVDLRKYESKADDLSREKKRRCLIDMLDKNQLYYNYADIDDSNVRSMISDSDYHFNKSFYNGGGIK